ncbi:MAG: DnaJ C-terminal domain-containing protein [Synechococcaceae cyanobacterium]|nr:DnaJ C-terminal domain-containing protein [Synechococcaceae cyanobacterium]
MSRSPTAAVEGRPDFWAVLGLAPGADSEALKRAFRQQARRWHPDLNGNDPVAEERFKLVNEAYAVLSDPRRRQAWEAGIEHSGSPQDLDPFASGFPPFEEYLAALFGERGEVEEPPSSRAGDAAAWPEREAGAPSEVAARPASPPPVRAADDLESLVALTPEQALAGASVELELPDGTVVEVWTPPLVGDGWRLRLAGVGPGGGDHFLQLQVRTAEGLRIDGLRVHFQLELSPADAALGCQAVVPTLDGPVRLRVPPGSSSGRLLRLRGRGLEHLGERGDQLVELRIVVEASLSEAEQALYRRLRELAEERHDG